MKGLHLTRALVGIRVSVAANSATIEALEADNVAKAATIATLQAENATLRDVLAVQAQVDEARWALDHLAWPDGRPIMPAEKSAAVDVLEADRIARTRVQLGGPHG